MRIKKLILPSLVLARNLFFAFLVFFFGFGSWNRYSRQVGVVSPRPHCHTNLAALTAVCTTSGRLFRYLLFLLDLFRNTNYSIIRTNGANWLVYPRLVNRSSVSYIIKSNYPYLICIQHGVLHAQPFWTVLSWPRKRSARSDHTNRDCQRIPILLAYGTHAAKLACRFIPRRSKTLSLLHTFLRNARHPSITYRQCTRTSLSKLSGFGPNIKIRSKSWLALRASGFVPRMGHISCLLLPPRQ